MLTYLALFGFVAAVNSVIVGGIGIITGHNNRQVAAMMAIVLVATLATPYVVNYAVGG